MAYQHGFPATRHGLSHVVDPSHTVGVCGVVRSALSGRQSNGKFPR